MDSRKNFHKKEKNVRENVNIIDIGKAQFVKV